MKLGTKLGMVESFHLGSLKMNVKQEKTNCGLLSIHSIALFGSKKENIMNMYLQMKSTLYSLMVETFQLPHKPEKFSLTVSFPHHYIYSDQIWQDDIDPP
jgi:hypothetical protein